MDRTLSLSVRFAAFDKLTAPLRRMATGAQATSRDLAATRKEIVQLERATGRIGAFKDLQRDLTATHAAMDDARRRVTALKAAIAQADGPTGRLRRQLESAEGKVEKLGATAGRQADRIARLGTELGEAGVDVRNLAREEERLGRSLDGVNKRLEQQARDADRVAARRAKVARMDALGGRMQGAGANAAAGGAAVLAPLALNTKSAISYADAFADIRKVAQGSDKDFARLDAGILKLSRRVPIAPAAIASIAAAGAQSGIAARELLVFAEDAAKMGVAFGMAPEEAGAAMSAWRAAFGMGQDQVRTLADQVNLLGNRNGNVGKIAEIVSRVGALGEVGGVAAPQVAALGATMAKMGVDQDIAATGIKNTILALTKGSAATKEQQSAFKALGLEATDVAQRMQRDGAGAITEVLARVAKLPKAQQAGLMTQLFGSESIGAIAPLLTQLDLVRANLRLAGDASQYAGSMQQEFAQSMQTPGARLQQMSARVEAMKVIIGNRLLPVVMQAADRIGALANSVGDFARRNPMMVQGLVMLATVVGTALTVLGGLGVAIGTVIGPVTRGAMMLWRFGQAVLWVIAALSSLLGVPVLVGAAIVAGVALIALALYNHWATVKAAFSGALNWLRGLVPAFRTIGAMMMQGLLAMLSPGRLAARVVAMAKGAVAAFKNVLGIHSPSRVFAEMGGHMMRGLSNGLEAGVRDPLASVRAAGAGLTAAMAVSAVPVTATPATPAAPVSAAPPAVAAAPVSAPPPAAPPTVINIYAQPGQDAQAIAQAVRAELDRRDAQQAARARATYEDRD